MNSHVRVHITNIVVEDLHLLVVGTKCSFDLFEEPGPVG